MYWWHRLSHSAWQVICRPAGWLWRILCWMGEHTPILRVWRLLGRMGLAWRRLLTWFVWRPLFFLSMPFWLPLTWFWELTAPFWRRVWQLLGRMGLAWRRLLTWLVWRPLMWGGGWLFEWLRRGGGWLYGRFRNLLRGFWRATAPRRAIWRQQVRSRWWLWRARLRVFLKRPKPPRSAIYVPHIPQPELVRKRRNIRLTTAVISLGIIFLISFINWQQPQPDFVAANSAPQIIVLTPTPLPPTPEPTPTVEIRLTPWATPDPLGGGGTLAFAWHRQGNTDIYLLPVGQSEPIRLTADPAPDRDPAWSPDGQSLAFTSRRDGNWEIYVYHLPSGKLRRVTKDIGYDGRPAWSPDSQWLVYEAYRDGNMDLYIVKADASQGPFRLTENPALDMSPVWSPGGRHIAFTSWRNGNRDIYLLSLDEVTDEAAVNLTASPGVDEDMPVFAPNGRFLAYEEHVDAFTFINAIPLTEDYAVAGKPVNLGQRGHDPNWSPDSQSVMYVYDRGEQSFLVAGRVDAFGVAAQTLVVTGGLSRPSWTAVTLTPDLLVDLRPVDTAVDTPLFTETVGTESEKRKLVELPVIAPAPFLSDDVDQSFMALRERVQQEAGWDVLGQLDDMFEPLEIRPLPGLNGPNWHKAGRAFDLAAHEALALDPRVEVVRVDVGQETYWRVYVKTAVQDGSQGEPLRLLPWDFRARFGDDPSYYDDGGKLKETIPAGYYVDFTALAADYGWQWVPAEPNWRLYFPAIRFWHYENRSGLSWEEAMLQLYTPDELSRLEERP